jgi:hypothetical protein
MSVTCSGRSSTNRYVEDTIFAGSNADALLSNYSNPESLAALVQERGQRSLDYTVRLFSHIALQEQAHSPCLEYTARKAGAARSWS